MSLDDKRILVIGGGSGIGFAVADAAVKAGAQVVVASTNAERIKAAAGRLGNRASPATLDITSEDQVAKFFAGSGPFDHIATTAGEIIVARTAKDGSIARAADEIVIAGAADEAIAAAQAVDGIVAGGRVAADAGGKAAFLIVTAICAVNTSTSPTAKLTFSTASNLMNASASLT